MAKKLKYKMYNGNIAQLVEQGAVNAQVVGSEPAIPAKYWKEVGLEAAIF